MITEQETINALDKIVSIILTVYERRLEGNEVQPYVVETQKNVEIVRSYIKAQNKGNPTTI